MMKTFPFYKINLLLLFITTSCLPSYAQDFLDIGNQWIFEYVEALAPGVYSHREIESITIVKDTFINGENYFKLEATRGHLCSVFSQTEYLRESGSKIYRLTQDLQDEYLVIDFSEDGSYMIKAEVGSQIIESEAIIDSFGITTFPDGNEVETQFMRIPDNGSFEESTTYLLHNKIGFLNPGLLFPEMGTGLCDLFGRWTINKCFVSGQDTIKFTDRGCYEFDIVDATQEVKLEELNIFPNPSYEIVQVPNNLTIVSMHDVNGRTLQVAFSKNELDVSMLQQGLYFIILEDKSQKKRYKSKFVKM